MTDASSVDRATLLATIARGQDAQAMAGVLALGLARLGWQDKQRFTTADVAQIGLALADAAREALAASADTHQQALAAGMARVVTLTQEVPPC